jgi:hypothetical protein
MAVAGLTDVELLPYGSWLNHAVNLLGSGLAKVFRLIGVA